MKTVKKYKRGKYKGWNIRQTNDGKFHVYKGTVNHYGPCKFISEAISCLDYHFL